MNAFFEGREMDFHVFGSGIFSKKKKIKVVPAKVVRAGIKISPKQGFKITNSTFTNKSR